VCGLDHVTCAVYAVWTGAVSGTNRRAAYNLPHCCGAHGSVLYAIQNCSADA